MMRMRSREIATSNDASFVHDQLVRVLRRGLAVDPRQRHEDMSALADALSRVLLDAGRREAR